MDESPSLEVFKSHVNVALRDMVQWWTWLGLWLDSMTLKVFSNLEDSVIVLFCEKSDTWATCVGIGQTLCALPNKS